MQLRQPPDPLVSFSDFLLERFGLVATMQVAIVGSIALHLFLIVGLDGDNEVVRPRPCAAFRCEAGLLEQGVVGWRAHEQRDLAHKLLTDIPGVSCVKPKAALYMFPRLDPKMYPIADDQQFAYELLAEEKVLIVQGTGFNWIAPDHFRVVFLPNTDDMTEAFGRIARFLEGYRRRNGQA